MWCTGDRTVRTIEQKAFWSGHYRDRQSDRGDKEMEKNADWL